MLALARSPSRQGTPELRLPLLDRQHGREEILRLHRDPLERTLQGPPLPRVERPVVQALGLRRLRDHRVGPEVHGTVGLDEGDARPEVDQEEPARQGAGDTTVHVKHVLVGSERVRQLDAQPTAPARPAQLRASCSNRQLRSAGLERPVCQGHRVVAEHERILQEAGLRREQLGLARIARGECEVLLEPGRHGPGAPGGELEPVERGLHRHQPLRDLLLLNGLLRPGLRGRCYLRGIPDDLHRFRRR
jgi:hypothetical protein